MRKLFVLLFLSMLGFGANAQVGKYGADSVDCIRNLSLYSELVKQNALDQAAPYWRKAFVLCPQSSENLYINGVRIYKYLLANEKNPSIKQKYIDSIMMLYDQRIEIFKHEKTVAWRKLLDYQQLKASDFATIYKMAEHCLQVTPDKNKYPVMEIYLNNALELYKRKKLETDVVRSVFTHLQEQLAPKMAEGDPDAITTNENIINVYVQSGAAGCADLVKIFRPRYEAQKTDTALLKKMVTLLGNSQCVGDTLFCQAGESLYRLEPGALLATHLAKAYSVSGQYEKAITYYKLAIRDEKSTAVQATLNVELGLLYYASLKQNREARDCANEAIRLDAKNGKAHLLLAQMYASDKSCTFNDFEKKALNWLVVDCYVKAKQADPGLSEIADKYINTYSQYFPTIEDVFFNGYENGGTFTIGCWINEKTLIRARR